MSWTDGPTESALPPPVGPPAAVPWGPPPSGPPVVADQVPSGASPTGHRGASPAGPVAPQYTRYASLGDEDGPISYAGFWRRFAGAFLDGLLLTLVNVPVNFVFQLVTTAFVAATQSLLVFALMVLANFAVNVFIWWRFVPGRIGASGASIGMGVMNIRLVPAKGRARVTSGLAFVRALLAGVLQILFMIPAGAYLAVRIANVDFDADDAFRRFVIPDAFVASVFAFLLLLVYLPTLWQLVDRRYQTLYDKACGVVVIND